MQLCIQHNSAKAKASQAHEDAQFTKKCPIIYLPVVTNSLSQSDIKTNKANTRSSNHSNNSKVISDSLSSKSEHFNHLSSTTSGATQNAINDNKSYRILPVKTENLNSRTTPNNQFNCIQTRSKVGAEVGKKRKL